MSYPTKRCLTALLVLTQILVACSSSSSRLSLRGPEPCDLVSNQTVPFSVEGTSQTIKIVEWSAGVGTFSKTTGITTNYTAPEVITNTSVIINASVTADGNTPELKIPCNIKPTTSTTAGAEGSPATQPQPEPSAQPTSPDTPPTPSEQATLVTNSPSTFERVIKNGRFTAIIRNDCSVFACLQGDKWEGFEADMMREFARRWFEREDAVDFMPVDSGDRIPSLTQKTDTGDIIAATLTITKKRLQTINFSTTYYQDGQRILIQATSSGINGPCDLSSKNVGVVRDSSGIEGITRKARECSPSFSIQNSLALFDSDLSAIAALRDGQIDAFTTDGILLEQLAKNFTDLKVVGNDFTDEPYGLGVRKEQNDTFLRLVNTTLQEMSEDGTYGAIHCKHFGNSIHPYPIAVIAGDLPQEFTELATTRLAPKIANTCSYDDLPKNHVIQPGDWLSKLAKQYYGNSSPSYWQIIYDKNKAEIGDDPDKIRVGSTLLIPELPPNFTSNIQP